MMIEDKRVFHIAEYAFGVGNIGILPEQKDFPSKTTFLVRHSMVKKLVQGNCSWESFSEMK